MGKYCDKYKRGTIEMLILKLLSEEDLYGYEMATLLNTISNHEITFNAGNMYPALYRLEEKGFITKRKEKVGKRVEFIYYLRLPTPIRCVEP